MAQYLGLDLSTQSFSAIIIDDQTGETVHEESVNFGSDLPGYNAPSGFVHGENEGEVFSDPCMWLDAMDLLFSRLQDKADLSRIRAVAGSGQQHARALGQQHPRDQHVALEIGEGLELEASADDEADREQ